MAEKRRTADAFARAAQVSRPAPDTDLPDGAQPAAPAADASHVRLVVPDAGEPAALVPPPHTLSEDPAPPEPAQALAGLTLPETGTDSRQGRERTNDAIPAKVMERVTRHRQGTRRDTASIVAAAVTKAYEDHVLPDLARAYLDRGTVSTLFGGHAPARQSRASSPVRLNYNPTPDEFRGYSALAQQLGISRAVLISLSLAHYYGMKDPASLA